ncbi:hypothetical protein [Paenibacillus athensensis]|nr:hypothetical protein [Paenibacillus athensensis]
MRSSLYLTAQYGIQRSTLVRIRDYFEKKRG